MRIAYISQSVIPSRSANSIQVVNMCRALQKSGHEVVLYGRRNAQKGRLADSFRSHYGSDPGFKTNLLRVPDMPGGGQLYGLMSARDARRRKVDLVYGRSIPGCFYSAMLGMPTVLELHGPVPENGIMKRLFDRIIDARSFVRLVVISQVLKDHCIQTHGLEEHQVLVAPDGAASHPETLPSPDLGPGFHVGYVGHLYPGKGMEIIERLVQAHPEIRFHVVGGLDRDIDRWSRRLHGSSNITFHGFKPHAEVHALLRSFDAVLAPYQARVEGFHGNGADIGRWMSPLKLFEYMEAGRPIVCSDLPVLREALVDEETALLVPPNDADAWANALSTLRDDPALARRIGVRAREVFLQRFTWERRAQNVIEGIDVLDQEGLALRVEREQVPPLT